MNAKTSVFAALLLALVTASGWADDRIAEKLAEAKATYRKAIGEARKPILKYLDEAESRARDAGNIDQVTALQGERSTFEDEGVIPKRLMAIDRSKSAEKARKAMLASYRAGAENAKTVMLNAYRSSVKDYLVAKNDVVAKKIKEEMDEFQKGVVVAGLSPENERAFAQMMVKLANSFPPVFRGDGWRIDQGELVQPSDQGYNSVVFGDPSWSNYDMTFKVTTLTGGNGFYVNCHIDGDDSASFELGGHGNTRHQYHLKYNGKTKFVVVKAAEVVRGKWYDIKLKVRGSKCQFFVDGVELCNVSEESLQHGRVGLATLGTTAKFKDIIVTTPDGNLLWKGNPVEVAR